MKICIIGSGNISHAIIGTIDPKRRHTINVLSSNPKHFRQVTAIDDIGKRTNGQIDYFSNDASIVTGSDLIIFTIPAFARSQVLRNIAPFVSENTIIGSFPGAGGFDWEVKKYIKNKPVIFSAQRVPFISRIKNYGENVLISRKESIHISVTEGQENKVKELLEDLLKIDVFVLANFLEVNLSNSNPILHSARLYTLFNDTPSEKKWESNILFYEEWDLASSELLIAMDDEFMKVISRLKLEGIKSLKEHYGVKNAKEMTEKLSSINAFKGIYSPMNKTTGGYVPDFSSRYFTEDIAFGLNIIKWFATSLNEKIPNIDRVIDWAKQNIPPNCKWIDCKTFDITYIK